MQRSLTYANGEFVFRGLNQPTAKKLISHDAWRCEFDPVKTDYICKTKSIPAAAVFRKHATERTERFFNRVFQKHYSLDVRLPRFLDRHQVPGVRWILGRRGSYLAHAPGAGKTAQALTAAYLASHVGMVLLIVPPSLTVNWEREIWKFTDKLDPNGHFFPKVSIIPESKRQRHVDWAADYFIVPDSMITRDWVFTPLARMRKKLVAVDEASRFKDPAAQRTVALFGGRLRSGVKTTGLVHNAKHVVLLDGSPMSKRPMELWAPTYALCPEAIDFRSRESFGHRYGGPTMNRFGRVEFNNASNMEELHEKLTRDFMHVVTEDELDHPERLRSMIYMSDKSPEERDARAWDRKLISRLTLTDIDEDLSHGDIATHRRELGLKKIHFIARYVAERLEQKSESILLFAWHREVAFELERLLSKFRPGLVVGGTKEAERERHFRRFNFGACRLIIGNIAAMGRGHNLQRATRVVFAEYAWNDELNRQCEKRASRRGSTHSLVKCDYIVAENTMDEIVLQSVFRSAERVRRVIG